MTRLEQALKRLKEAGYTTSNIEKLNGGINSEIFKARCNDRGEFALKIYPKPTHTDQRNRCKTETNFLEYLHECGAKNTPRLEASNINEGWNLIEWVEGKKQNYLGNSDLKEITNFIHAINDKSLTNIRSELKPASEACQSILELIKGIKERIERYSSSEYNTGVEREARKWVSKIIKPYFESVCKELLPNRQNCSHWQESEINKIASPSDVGIHNTIKTKRGLYFLDFEYAGLDDLSKLAADWILQPEYQFNKEQEELFCKLLYSKMKKQHGDSWLERLEDIKPLIHIKWCLIMLNPAKKAGINKNQLDKAYEYFKNHKIK